MNKTELIAKVVEETQLSKKDAAAAVNATFAAITGELVKGDVAVPVSVEGLEPGKCGEILLEMAYEPCLVEGKLVLVEDSVMVCVIVIGKLQELPIAVPVSGDEMAEAAVRVSVSGRSGSCAVLRRGCGLCVSCHDRHGRD